jgi:hypothetical protein
MLSQLSSYIIMERQSFVYESLRMLCATPEFGDQLFSMLTPLDICAILHVFDVHITQKQIRTYMQVWRQFFIHKDWATQLISHGFEVSLVGNDLITLIAWMNNPSLMNIGRTPSLYLDLRIVSPVASRRLPLSAFENIEYLLQEKQGYLTNSANITGLTHSLEYGILATYSEIVLGKHLDDDCTVSPWLNLTVSSAIKHKAIDPESPYSPIRIRPDSSVTLGYGQKTMQRWPVPLEYRQEGSVEVEMGVMIDLKSASCLSVPLLYSSPRFLRVLVVADRCRGSGAYMLREERSYNYIETIDMIERQLMF